jgi:hypothetical protein
MEVWNREELYAEVWEQPLLKLAEKYGCSAVMLGKICRKLQIPVPGRGYWAKKQFGKPVKRKPLPAAKNLPVVHRYEPRPPAATAPETITAPPPEPTDPEYLQIKEVESRTIVVSPEGQQHKLVAATERALRHARTDDKGFLVPHWEKPCLDLRVSSETMDRALNILNAVILATEGEKFSVTVERAKYGTVAHIFSQHVPFSIVERYREVDRHKEVVTPTWTRTAITYRACGELEFRVGGDKWGGWRLSEGKRQRLENVLPTLVGALLRDARSRVIRAEQERQEAIKRRQREIELLDLRGKIEAEETKLHQFEAWVAGWVQAGQMREFIAELEGLWNKQGHDLGPESPKGQRLMWMRQQADRADPLVDSPPSIIDRKNEVSRYSW